MNPITFEMLRSEYGWICSQGSAMLRRVANSPVVTEGHDFAVALLTRDGRLVAHGVRDHTPYLGTFEATVRAVLEDVEEFEPGDVYIFNDPYRGGTHAQDVRLVRPIFASGQLFGFTIAACHWADIGGPVPGSFNPSASECYAEGLHLPVMRLYERDRPVKSTFELVRLNVRMAHDRVGDLMAQYQATRQVERKLLECVDRYGKETVERSFEELFAHSLRVFKKEISALPDGTYEFEDFIDQDVCSDDKRPIKIHCKLIIDGCNVTIDWTASDPAPCGPTGLTRPALLSATFDGTLHCFPDMIPLNHGVISSISVISTPGTVTHVTRPSPVSSYCSGAYEKACASVMGAWAQPWALRDPTRVYAGTVNLQDCVIAGVDPESRSPFLLYLWLEGGQGARSFKDGPSFAMTTYAAGAWNQSCEVQERRYPVLYTKVEAVADSCGDGKFRGGFGMCREFMMLANGKVSIHGDRERFTPYGLGGGTNGGPNLLILNGGEAGERNLGMFATDVPLKEGDRICLCSNGGGGYGDPLERDPKAVLDDVIDEFISLEKAKEVYGVVIRCLNPDALQYEIDWEATVKLRRRLAKKETTVGFGPWQVHPHGRKVAVSKS